MVLIFPSFSDNRPTDFFSFPNPRKAWIFMFFTNPSSWKVGKLYFTSFRPLGNVVFPVF